MGVAEREEPLMHETALAGSIPHILLFFFVGNSCQVRYVSYIGLRIVVTNVVEGQGFYFSISVSDRALALSPWDSKLSIDILMLISTGLSALSALLLPGKKHFGVIAEEEIVIIPVPLSSLLFSSVWCIPPGL